jgi:hypothetical protein
MLYADGKPIYGLDDTYLKNDWGFKTQDMQTNTIKAMKFKEELGSELPGNKDQDILLICGTDNITCDTIRYQTNFQVSAAPHRASYVTEQGFSFPYDSGQHGDAYVPTTSAMASMSGLQKYKNSALIPVVHTSLSNEKNVLEIVGRFLLA